MNIINFVVVFLGLLIPPTSIHVTVQDESGAPLPNALVIVESLNDRKESVRYLSDANGSTPAMTLKPGLYRVIATYPYGPWQTVIREFAFPDSSNGITLRIPAKPSDEFGEIIGAPQDELMVEVPTGEPLVGVPVLIRTKDATHEKWYRTGAKGEATISVIADPLIAVVLYRNKPYSYQLGAVCPQANSSTIATDIPCVKLGDGSVVLHVSTP